MKNTPTDLKIQLEFDMTDTMKEVLENLPEYAPPYLPCINWDYNNLAFTFLVPNEDDEDTAKTETITLADLKPGLILMAKEDRLKLPYHLDSGNWDSDDMDVLLQYVLLGDIIYG